MRRGRMFVLWYLAMVTSCWLAVVRGSGGFCPAVCTCKWKSGKQSVECNDKGLIDVPQDIDSETQLLDISNNNLQVLPKETFVRARLLDLQKVYLRNCRIGQIDDRALVRLSNVVDLDLSHNLLTAIPSSIFLDVPNLRNLSLAHNPIQKIDAAAFENVGQLTKLDLSHCQIAVIASRAFSGLDSLELLRLNGNRLTELKLSTVDSLKGLHGIELHDNLWHCDCNLRALKVWLIAKNMPYPIEPTCNGGPARVHNKSFNQLQADDFACRPEMKIKPEHRYIESAQGDNATILCKVESIPEATISWYWNGRLLLNNSAFSPYERIVIHHSGDVEKKSVLTLTNAQEQESSQFHCMAENQAGVAEANFTLRVVRRLAGFAVFDQNPVTSISLGLLALCAIILVIVLYLTHCIRKMPTAREVKHASGGEEVIANGAIHAVNDDKTLTIEPSLAVKRAYANNVSSMYPDESQTLPRRPTPSYNSVGPRFEGLCGSPTANNNVYHHQSSNPDLIADTRYQDDLLAQNSSSGVYTRSDNMFYPSSLWSEDELLAFRSSGGDVVGGSDFREDTNDRTPIIEQVPSNSFYEGGVVENVHRRPLKDCEFPTTSSLGGESGSMAAAYGPPNDAKIMRVWQKGVHVLPPVTALKRVLNRNSPDEGYQEGCGTDV